MLPQLPIESHIESHIFLIISKSQQNLCSFKTPKVQISCQQTLYHKMSGFNINLLTYKYCLDNSIKVDWIKPKMPISSEILLAKIKRLPQKPIHLPPSIENCIIVINVKLKYYYLYICFTTFLITMYKIGFIIKASKTNISLNIF